MPWNTRSWRRCRQASCLLELKAMFVVVAIEGAPAGLGSMQLRCVGMLGLARVNSNSFRSSQRTSQWQSK